MRSARAGRALAAFSAMVMLAALALASALTTPAQAAQGSGSREELNARAGKSGAFVGHGATSKLRFFGTKPGHAASRPSEISASDKPASAATKWLARYGALFGVSDAADSLQTRRVVHAGHDSIVKLQQTVSGLPVVGGELVVTLDSGNQLISINGEALPESTVDTTVAVSSDKARMLAIKAVGRSNRGVVLAASDPVKSVLDERLMGGAAFGQARTVWATLVSSADNHVRHRVFIDATRGSLVLDIDANPADRNRVVCTANNHRISDPTCSPGNSSVAQVGTEAAPPASSDADAYNAYRYSGAVYDFYKTLFGRDSIDNAGMTLASTVDFCPPASDPDDISTTCSGYANAFWDGTEMVYGDNFASALDVVGHELTHGVTERTSNLLSYYQSGAINESISDVMGELIQQIQGPALNAVDQHDAYDPANDWILGDKLPVPFTRNMKDPTADSPSDPDRMTSSDYNAFLPWQDGFDGGGVHANDGVNNKAAYLMARGTADTGPFNGITMEPVSGANQTERNVKVAHIYYQLESLMTSASDYADLYNLLPQACDLLVTAGSLPMPDGVSTTSVTAGDCAAVRAAVAATAMDKQPSAAGAATRAEAPICTNGGAPTDVTALETSDGPSSPIGTSFSRGHASTSDNQGGLSFGNWWWSKQAITDYGSTAQVPAYAASGTGSLYGDDADPSMADPSTYDRQDSWIQTRTPIAAAYGGTMVRFRHAWEFDYGPITNGGTPYYFDGGRVEYSVDNGAHWYDAGAASPVTSKVLLVNGGYNGTLSNTSGVFGAGYVDPNPLKGAKAFVGSSHGWTSSRIDLAPVAGKDVLLRWRIGSDDAVGALGWYLDDVRTYHCNPTDIVLTTPYELSYNHTGTVTAKLRSLGNMTMLANKPVQLYARKHGTTAWVAVGPVKMTNSSGSAAWSIKPTAHWDYYARFAAGPSYAPYAAGTSRAAVVWAREVVTRTAVPSSFTLGHAFTVSGSVWPKLAGQPVRLERYYSGAWHLVAGKNLTSASGYTFTYKPTTRATYSFRVYQRGDAGHFASSSAFTLKVT